MGTPTAGRLPMTRASGPSKELHALVAWCRETRNPTVFWNKEDTPNYARLIATAKLFDHVFTRRRIANHLYPRSWAPQPAAGPGELLFYGSPYAHADV
jgi:hypothetical protein